MASKCKETIRVASKQLTLLETKLKTINTELSGLGDADDDIVCILEEYKDQVTEIKTEVATIKTTLLTSDTPTDDPIVQTHTRIEKLSFDCLFGIKRRIRSIS